MSQILSETPLDNTQREYVDIIRGSAKALLSLINDVLDLSKIEADRLELEHVDFDPARRDLRDRGRHGPAIGRQGHRNHRQHRAPTCPCMARGDPGRLRQIIMNLIGNAIKFTHEGHVVLDATGSRRRTRPPHPAHRGHRHRHRHSRPIASTACSRPSRKSIPPPPATTAAAAWDCPSSSASPNSWAARSACAAKPGRGSTLLGHRRRSMPCSEQPQREPVGLGRRMLIVDDVPASRRSLASKLGLVALRDRLGGGRRRSHGSSSTRTMPSISCSPMNSCP